MNKYLVQCSIGGEWVPFNILDTSIHTALDWVHENVQRIGVCISLDNSLPSSEPVQDEETFGEWSERRIEQRARRRAYLAALATKNALC